jgi:hypothetical protein
MTDDKIQRLPIARDELDATLRATLARDEMTRIQLGEGPEAIIVADAYPRRQCGQCTFCCTAAGVNELEKLPMKRCQHLRDGGCGIYPDRPSSCAKFSCGWLIGNFDERFRPDKIGAYVAFFMTEEFGFYAVVQMMTARAKPKRIAQMIKRLLVWVPEVRVVVDDAHGTIYRHDKPPCRFIRLDREPGDYETLIYRLLDPR